MYVKEPSNRFFTAKLGVQVYAGAASTQRTAGWILKDSSLPQIVFNVHKMK